MTIGGGGSSSSGKPAPPHQPPAAASCCQSSPAFQLVKQTQSSLARLTRAHPPLAASQQPTPSQAANSSQVANNTASAGHQTPAKTFVDCLIRRFRDAFSEDLCEIPVFVVGNLSPGLDGSHLILPPCVSLSGQSICRCSTPKNLRLMSSLRDSCRSIEELDLAANKLTDLIEVYKILMLTSNLRFLNLSENDLSRTLPVACASQLAVANTSTTNSDSSSLTSFQSNSAHSGGAAAATSHVAATYAFSALPTPAPVAASYGGSSTSYARSRSALGQQPHTSAASLQRRKQINQHCSDGAAPQAAPAATNNARLASKTLEARRLAAATAALAQSKKTCARSAAAAVSAVRSSASATTLSASKQLCGGGNKQATAAAATAAAGSQQRHQQQQPNSQQQHQQQQQAPSDSRKSALAKRTPSTLHLARSLSSLTAVDVRCATRNASARPVPVPARNAVRQLRQQQQRTSSLLSSSPTTTATTTTTTAACAATIAATNTSNNSYYYRRTFDSIKALALNNTRCPWKTVCSILLRMPNLEELHLSLNNYERIDFEPVDFRHTSLRRLYLCNNPKLTDWQELNKLLAAFPSLEALSLADCAISQIPENLDSAREWQKLCGLNITGWPIKEWPIIERLNALPSLVDLKCRNVQVLNDINEPRHHLIARLPKLQRLNGSEIEERDLAEKEFLRFFMIHAHLERPNRFHELVQIHGHDVAMPVVDVDVDLSPPNTAHVRVVYLNKNYYASSTTTSDDLLMSEDFLSKLMQVANSSPIAMGDGSSINKENNNCANNDNNNKTVGGGGVNNAVTVHKDECKEVLAVSVDLRQSVRKFKTNLCAMLGLQLGSTNDLFLYYIDHEMVGLMGPELLKHNQKKLWNYNVRDGDQFIVEQL